MGFFFLVIENVLVVTRWVGCTLPNTIVEFQLKVKTMRR